MKYKLTVAALIATSFAGGRLTQTNRTGSALQEPVIALPAKVVSVHDGDTLRVKFELESSVRMLDCWASELKEGEKGLQSKENLLRLCPEGSDVIVQIPFKADISKMFTFGRVLGYVYKDGENISELQVLHGFATKEKK